MFSIIRSVAVGELGGARKGYQWNVQENKKPNGIYYIAITTEIKQMRRSNCVYRKKKKICIEAMRKKMNSRQVLVYEATKSTDRQEARVLPTKSTTETVIAAATAAALAAAAVVAMAATNQRNIAISQYHTDWFLLPTTMLCFLAVVIVVVVAVVVVIIIGIASSPLYFCYFFILI